MPFSALLIPSLIVFIIAENGITGDPVLDFAYRSLEQGAPFLRIAFPFVLTICCAWAGFFIVKHWRLFALGLGERPIEELKDPYRSQPFGTAFMPFLILYLSYFSAGLMFSQAIWLYDSCSPHDTLAALRSGTQCKLSEATIPYVAIAYDQFLRGLLGDFVELFFS